MTVTTRMRSPRAPSMPLDEAIDRTAKAYARDRLNSASTEVVAQRLGYKNANSGAALQAIASLRYYGLLDRPSDGMLAVSKTFDSYLHASDKHLQRQLQISWLKKPALFAELLDEFAEGLPSDDALRRELVQRHFSLAATDNLIAVFRRSVDFVDYFVRHEDAIAPIAPAAALPADFASANSGLPISMETPSDVAGSVDRIPIRLPGGRRAWLHIPSPFYSGDKERIKAQVDLLLADDEENE